MKTIEVVAAVIQSGETYYCAQRIDEGELAKKWEFPGGKIEAGETHHEAIKREIFEELGALIDVDDFIMTVHHTYHRFHLVMHAYRCHIKEGSLVLSEHLDDRWVRVKDMHQLDFAAADLPIIEMIKTFKKS